MAEEVGVEPTRRCLSTSLVLKTRHPTGDVALPELRCYKVMCSHPKAVMPLGNEAFFNNTSIDDCPLISASARKANTIKILEYFDSQFATDAQLVLKCND